ncbi:hypothetical protein BH11CYA1_BH11CYA1_09140 [soil metagenome]
MRTVLLHLIIYTIACLYSVALTQSASLNAWLENIGLKLAIDCRFAVLSLATFSTIPLTIALQIGLAKIPQKNSSKHAEKTNSDAAVLQTDAIMVIAAFPLAAAMLSCFAAKRISLKLKHLPGVSLETYCDNPQTFQNKVLKLLTARNNYLPIRIAFFSYLTALMILWFFGSNLATQPTTTASELRLVVAGCHLVSVIIFVLAGLTVTLSPGKPNGSKAGQSN